MPCLDLLVHPHGQGLRINPESLQNSTPPLLPSIFSPELFELPDHQTCRPEDIYPSNTSFII